MDIRPAQQMWLPLKVKGEVSIVASDTKSPVGEEQLMEQVLARGNLESALGRVETNKGSAGVLIRR
jgi:hypothetical protein